MWVTDVTSRSSRDDSLLGLIYTDSQTGKSVFYLVAGGATAKAVLASVNKNSDVQYRHLRGDYVHDMVRWGRSFHCSTKMTPSKASLSSS